MNRIFLLVLSLLASDPCQAAQITVEIEDTQKDRIINGICGQYGYQDKIQQRNPDGTTTEVPNPLTKAQFAKQILVRFVKEVVTAREANVAEQTARKQAIEKTERELAIS